MSAPITVTVAATKGSVPREAGTLMRIWPDRISGTIGGGALEWQAIGLARQMLAEGRTEDRRTYALGPDMGQCCGGSVTLDFALGAVAQAPNGPPLWIWGAGHVGRAIAQVMAPMQRHAITLIDVAENRFPAQVPSDVDPLVAAEPLRLVPRVPEDGLHLIVTYSHDLDLALCNGLLHHGFGFAGLIGSATKWARFRKRLVGFGHSEAYVQSITCPIGDPALGKHPQAIAVGVATQLLSRGKTTAQAKAAP